MTSSSSKPPPSEPQRGLAPRRRDAGDAARGRGGEEEEVLRGLLLAEQPILEDLGLAKAKLAAGVLESLGEPRRALVLAKVLREVVAISGSISKRQQNVATALAALRAQRQMLALHGSDQHGV